MNNKEYEALFNDCLQRARGPDEVKEMMVMSGVPFKSVTRLYNQFMIGKGLAFDADTKRKIVRKVLEGKRLNTKRAFAGRSASVKKALKDTITERSADALVRAFAKRNEVEVWQKPEKEDAVRVSFMKQFCDFLEANPFATEKAVVRYLDKGTATYIKRNRNTYMEIWRMVQVITRKHDNGS